MTASKAQLMVSSTTAGAVAVAALLLAAPASAAPTAQDAAFLKSNEQVNLAEITIGTIALQRAKTSTARSVATKTISDHRKAMAKVTALAASEHVTLPTVPNALQQSQAATLKSIASAKFDLTYLQFQVAGHDTSIAATHTEISSGTDTRTVAYATYYLPVAAMHLKMARAGVTTLGGDPSAVPAGSGGQGAVTSSTQIHTAWTGGLLGVVLATLGGLGLIRRRRSVAR